MKRIHVNSTIQEYDILIDHQIRFQLSEHLKKNYSQILIITDSNVTDLYGKDIMSNFDNQKVNVEVVPAGEESKNIRTYYHLLTRAVEYGLDRHSLIIALGGGVIGDLAGFVAATYMRGIDYIQVPTTILAHDSSIGGKVAINHSLGKNLIGNYYPPVLVLYDMDTLQTLPEKEIRSGYAEIVKEALIGDDLLFEKLMSKTIDEFSSVELAYFIEKGIRIKANIVEEDEREAGKRMFLNLGHTLGHAIEATLGYGNITHGEAVAIGLLFALYVSQKELQADLPFEELKTWLTKNGYPVSLSMTMVHELMKYMKHDKKVVDRQIQMVLLQNHSNPVIHTLDDSKLNQYLSSFIKEI